MRVFVREEKEAQKGVSGLFLYLCSRYSLLCEVLLFPEHKVCVVDS